jgi:hypothetical protein
MEHKHILVREPQSQRRIQWQALEARAARRKVGIVIADDLVECRRALEGVEEPVEIAAMVYHRPQRELVEILDIAVEHKLESAPKVVVAEDRPEERRVVDELIARAAIAEVQIAEDHEPVVAPARDNGGFAKQPIEPAKRMCVRHRRALRRPGSLKTVPPHRFVTCFIYSDYRMRELRPRDEEVSFQFERKNTRPVRRDAYHIVAKGVSAMQFGG